MKLIISVFYNVYFKWKKIQNYKLPTTCLMDHTNLPDKYADFQKWHEYAQTLLSDPNQMKDPHNLNVVKDILKNNLLKLELIEFDQKELSKRYKWRKNRSIIGVIFKCVFPCFSPSNLLRNDAINPFMPSKYMTIRENEISFVQQ